MVLMLRILMDALFIVVLVWCAYTDLKARTVSNVFVTLLLCLGLAHTALMLLTGSAWWSCPAGLALGVPFFIAWLRGHMGAGDVKLIMGIGLYLGLINTLLAFALMLPALIVWMLLFRRKNRMVKSAIPFAPVLAFGAGTAMLAGYFVMIISWAGLY